MKRKIALMMSSVLLCAAIFGGCATYALAKAKDYYYTFSMSKSGVYEQLVSEYGEQFTESEAQYAIDHLED